MHDMLELGNGRWNLSVAPLLGGSLLACTFDGVPVLQPVVQAPRAGHPAVRCCHFPLIPFSNRIENGRFSFNGSPMRLAQNFAGSPHAMHGHGWQAAWQVAERLDASCALTYQQEPATDWPWRYRGRQTIAVAGDALRLTLAIENLGPDAMPCGLGFHPFLPRPAGARLELEAVQVWNGTAGAFPTTRVDVPAALDFRAGPLLSEREGTDHCFDGWKHRATVRYEQGTRTLILDGCEETAYAIVYIPEGADYFCVEPVTHAVNAMNHADAAAGGVWTLKPGATREISMTIQVEGTVTSGAHRR
jgi:aldose 1-epimerase